jgi:hypothetical protein
MDGDSYLGTEGIGTQTWNTNGHSADFVFHESVPQEAGFVSEPEPDGTHGTHGTQNKEEDTPSGDKKWREVL